MNDELELSSELEEESISNDADTNQISSSDVTLNEIQYNELSSALDGISSTTSDISSYLEDSQEIDYTGYLSGISNTLDSMSASFSSSASSSVESDSGSTFELQTTQTFLLSLVVGLLVCWIFVSNFIKH